MTEAQFLRILKRIQGDRSLRAFARDLEVSPAYLSDVFLGRRLPGPAILDQLSYERVRKVTTTIRKKV